VPGEKLPELAPLRSPRPKMWRMRWFAAPVLRKLTLGSCAVSGGIATTFAHRVCGDSGTAAATDTREISSWHDVHNWHDVAHLIEHKLEDSIIHPLRDTFVRYSGYSVYLGALRSYPPSVPAPFLGICSRQLHLQVMYSNCMLHVVYGAAYTSDLGESFARILPSWAYYTTYGISAAYVIGDVAYNGYKQVARTRERSADGNPDWAEVRLTCLHASVYQVAPFFRRTHTHARTHGRTHTHGHTHARARARTHTQTIWLAPGPGVGCEILGVQFIVSLAFPYFVIHNTVHRVHRCRATRRGARAGEACGNHAGRGRDDGCLYIAGPLYRDKYLQVSPVRFAATTGRDSVHRPRDCIVPRDPLPLPFLFPLPLLLLIIPHKHLSLRPLIALRVCAYEEASW
jgi:hypothetical protein